MSVEEVREQISYVALVTKQASQVSDLRSHHYSASFVQAPVVYFRGWTPGVCTYFDDRKGALVPYPHGACWYSRCQDLRVIDVPGDHFSLLRQDEEDMNILVTALKMVLGPFGWSEIVQHQSMKMFEVAASEIQDIDDYLKRMGVKDPSLRQKLETSMPYATSDGVATALQAAGKSAAPIYPVNSLASALSDKQPKIPHQQPVLLVCCDANGSLGGMEKIFSTIDMPVFAVRVPSNDAIWESAEISELASIAIKAIQRSLPQSTFPLLLSGIGFGAVLAHELAIQFDNLNDRVALLALFEGAYAVSNPDTSLNWLSGQARKATCQAASALYELVCMAAGERAPSLDAFAARLASIKGFDAQLDYVASFKPRNEDLANWDKQVDEILARLGYYKTIAEGYMASDIFNGQTLVFASSKSVLSSGGPAGCWESIRYLIQPAAIYEFKVKGANVSSASNLAQILSQSLLEAMNRRAEAEAENSLNGVSNALSMMSPRSANSTMDAHSLGSSAPLQSGTSSIPGTPGASTTLCMVLPLNRLCPERRYILRRTGRTGTHAKLSRQPLCRIPLWLLHTERGDISGAQKEIASLLPLPCYGLALGPDADKCESMDELVTAQYETLTSVQTSGPYLIMGTSIVGCTLAHAIAGKLESEGKEVGLILLDGCIGTPDIPLHDPTWYALFYLLREIGTLKGQIGEFVDYVRGAGTPTRQLKLISSFKPSDIGVSAEAWDAAVYATLDRAAVLKKLVQPAKSSSKDAEHEQRGASATFGGAAAVVVPSDRLGTALFQSSQKAFNNPRGVVNIPLESRHTECLLTSSSRTSTAVSLEAALLNVLQQLDGSDEEAGT